MVRAYKPNSYDFWVCPGGGVKDTEPLEAAAAREVQEETGLTVAIGQLAYIEEFFSPETRFIKFWFIGRPLSGSIDVSHPEAVQELIVQAAWRTRSEISSGAAFPEVLTQRFFEDFTQGFNSPIRLPMRAMQFW